MVKICCTSHALHKKTTLYSYYLSSNRNFITVSEKYLVLTWILENFSCMLPITPFYQAEVVEFADMWTQSLLGASN